MICSSQLIWSLSLIATRLVSLSFSTCVFLVKLCFDTCYSFVDALANYEIEPLEEEEVDAQKLKRKNAGKPGAGPSKKQKISAPSTAHVPPSSQPKETGKAKDTPITAAQASVLPSQGGMDFLTMLDTRTVVRQGKLCAFILVYISNLVFDLLFVTLFF